MNVERSRQFGQAMMAGSVLSLLLFLAGVKRRSYMALAIPVAVALAAIAGLTFWVGYTMATTRWDEEDVEPADEERPPAPEPSVE